MNTDYFPWEHLCTSIESRGKGQGNINFKSGVKQTFILTVIFLMLVLCGLYVEGIGVGVGGVNLQNPGRNWQIHTLSVGKQRGWKWCCFDQIWDRHLILSYFDNQHSSWNSVWMSFSFISINFLWFFFAPGSLWFIFSLVFTVAVCVWWWIFEATLEYWLSMLNLYHGFQGIN